MTQFVQSGLFRPFQQEIQVGGLFVELGAKPMDGNDGASPLNLRQPEDVLEDRHKEVHLGHPDQPNRIRWTARNESLQDELGVVLAPRLIEGVSRVFCRWVNQARKTASNRDPLGKMIQNPLVEGSHGANGNDRDWELPPRRDVVLFHLVVEGLTIDFQHAGRLPDVPVGLSQDLLDVHFLHQLQGPGKRLGG